MIRWTKRGFSPEAARSGAGLARLVLLLAVFASPASSAWTVLGTTVQLDGNTGYPDVRVTLFPDSLVSVSDAHGDFVITWNGERGWLAFVPPQKGRDGRDWCFRYALPPRSDGGHDSTLDIGAWRIYPNVPVQRPFNPAPPPGMAMLPRLRIPGPPPGEPGQYRQVLRPYVDIWGRGTRVEEGEGDPHPTRVRDALKDHLMKIPWVVQSDTPCGDLSPFSVELRCFYQWQDSVWIPMAKWDEPVNPPRSEPGKAAGSRTPPSK